MNNYPLVSIITPTYNSHQFIEETINSLLNQTYSNWELIITDDCSSDDTWKILNNYAEKDNRIKIFRLEQNSGAGIARNNSIKQSNGRFIAFCDSDDQWKPHKLMKQILFMIEKDSALSYSGYNVINEDGEDIGLVKVPENVSYKSMLRNDYIGCLTAIYDTDIVGKMYLPEIRKRQDWALWLAILKITPQASGLQESLAIYRSRNQSISSNKFKVMKYIWIVYRKIERFSIIKSTYFFLTYIIHYFHKKSKLHHSVRPNSPPECSRSHEVQNQGLSVNDPELQSQPMDSVEEQS
ncbi:MAG: glycosyltransferase family 2 protein [Balneolales bacterium]